MKSKLPYLYILSIMSMTSSLFGNMPVFERHYIFMGLALLLSYVLSSSFFNTKQFLMIVIYTVFICLNFLLGCRYFLTYSNLINEFFALFFPSVLIYYSFLQGKMKYAQLFMCIYLVLFAYSAAITYVIHLQHPFPVYSTVGALSFAGGDAQKAMLYTSFMKIGMADYGLCHSVPILIPPLVCATVNKNNSKWLRILFGVILFLSLLLSIICGAATVFILSIVALFLSCLCIGYKSNEKRRVWIALIVILPLLFSDDLQIKMFDFGKELVGPDSFAYPKIEELKKSIIYGEDDGDLYERKELYNKTLSNFSTNFLIGTIDNNELGGHQALIDRFMLLGIIGFLPLILFFKSILVFIWEYIPTSSRLYFLISILMALLMSCLKNMFNLQMTFILLFIAPMILYYYSTQDHQTTYEGTY